MLSSRDFFQKYCPISLPSPDSYSGKIVVVTGATSGLGLAAAVHFINLGASQVIITGRDVSKAERAKKTIEAATGHKGRDKIKIMQLDMNRYSSIVYFVDELKLIRKGRGGVDYVLLNAGVGAANLKLSPEGLEEDLQVNGVSTTLLGLLLLSSMRKERENRDAAAHIAFVNSGQAALTDIQNWPSWAAEEGVFAHLSKETNWPGNGDAYNNSKLISLYGTMELSKLSIRADGRPDVIINPVCPGIVKTDIVRDSGAIASAFVSVLGKSPDHGARSLVKAGLTTENENGKFINFYSNDDEFLQKFNNVLLSELGKKTQSLIWTETLRTIIPKVPEVKNIIDVK
ncbi:NAD(P)-binding protein [Annulohypoxylon moriforme]|nr:NAD(P)-binding protein [Annulohypoxylon moriforme]